MAANHGIYAAMSLSLGDGHFSVLPAECLESLAESDLWHALTQAEDIKPK